MKKCNFLMLIISFLLVAFTQVNYGRIKYLNAEQQYLASEPLHIDSIQVKTGWNLLSLPVKILDGTKSVLFPSATSDAFLYENEYIHKDTMANGAGYWLKFDSDETIILTGEAIHRDTINVREGWNMIGTLTEILPANMVVTEPPGIIVSDFFNYLSQFGYEESDTIKPGVGYWVKVNQNGVIILSSGGEPCPSTVDYEGKTYNTVQIGNQCWLKENLDIGIRIDRNQEQTDNSTIEKYCYDDNPSYCNTYGGLYQWNEVMQYSTMPGTRGICPLGWHIPTLSEFQVLSTAVDEDGNAIKAIGQGTGAGEGTNTTGFSALLAGLHNNGIFYYLDYYATFWSSAEYYSANAYCVYLYDYNGSIDLSFSDKGDGYSIRCLQD